MDKLLKRTKKKQAPVSQKAAMESKFKKDDVLLSKQKVTLHYPRFGFFAYVSCYSDRKCDMLVNTGGQVFRFPEHEFKEGLYKEAVMQAEDFEE